MDLFFLNKPENIHALSELIYLWYIAVNMPDLFQEGASEFVRSQAPSPKKRDSAHGPESRLTLDQLSPEVKPFATHLSEYILSLCKKHGIVSDLDTTDNTNLSQAVSDSVAMYIEKLPSDPSLMEDAKKLIQLQNRLTSIHEQNRIPEEQEGDLHLVDLSNDPLPDKWKQEGWVIAKHKGEGILELDPSMLQLYFSPKQQSGSSIKGNELMDELEKDDIPVLNACVLDYLLTHPELIPEDWKNKGNIYFSATQFRRPNDILYVRYLRWRNDVWDWGFGSLGVDWNISAPSAILASVLQP